MSDIQRAAVADFFDTHPINEFEILQKLSTRGLEQGPITEDDLQEFDQDHYGGTEAKPAPSSSDCLFRRIASGFVPSHRVFASERLLGRLPSVGAVDRSAI